MTIYKLLDGKEIAATSHSDFANRLRNGSFFPCETVEDYMAEFSKRVYILFSVTVRSDTTTNFVDDLIRLKIVTIIQTN